MAVTERLMGAGNFGVSFLQDQTPSEVIDTIQEWGHIVITPQEMNPDLYDDSAMLASARYTGIVLSKSLEEGVVQVSGKGLQLYLGDDRGKGMVIAENKNLGKARTYTDLPLSSVLFQSSTPYGIMRNEAGNLQAITQGTIYDGSSTYSGTHFVETSLHALKHICEDLGYEFRVNQDATVDAGPAANLFTGVNSDPTTVVVKTGYGDDPTYQGISPTGARTEFDAADYVTKVDFIAEIGAFNDPTDFEGEASKTSGEIPYYDIHGNKLSRTGLVSVPDMDSDKLDEQAGLMLTELSKIKKVLNLDLEQYEVTGDLKVGDFIFAFDPFIGFTDNETDATAESRDIYEISFRGQQINPVKVRVVGLSFPISTGMGVYYRKFDGTNVTYTDLTPYVSFENGDTQVELGDVLRDVSDDLRFNEYSIAARTASAKSIPDLPSTPTLQSGTYQDGTGESKGFVRIVFSKPSNIDGSNIVDGSHYRVRYRISDGLSTSGGTSANEYTFKDFPFTGSSTESLVISDLTVGKAYRVGVATVDTSSFRRKSDYTASGEDLYTDSPSVNPSYTTNAIIEIDRDGQAPSKPKQAQSIAAGPLRVQLTHYLGKEGTDGNGNPFGDFTLEGDVDHLDIHAVTQSGNTASFTVNTANKIGEIRVTSGNILQQIPVIGTMELEDSQDYYFRIVAVDKSGNASNPSDGQAALANLIAEANIADATITTAKIGEAQITNALIADATITSAKINDLTADKITAGTIDASVITVTNLDADNITSGSIDTSLLSFTPVDSGNIVGTINASTEGITINTNKLTLTGVLQVGDAADDINTNTTTISGGKITAGTLSVTNAEISGTLDFAKITQSSVNIIENMMASNSVNSSAIKNGNVTTNEIASATSAGSFGTNGNDLFADFLGVNSGTIGNKFSADNTGVNLTGVVTINPTSGNIGNGNTTGNFTNLYGDYIDSSGNIFAIGTIRSESYHSATRYYDINSSSNMDLASSFVYLKHGDAFGLNVSTSTSTIYSTFQPSNDGGKNLGTSSRRWSTVYRISESSTSDERLKENIIDINYGLDFINNLRPREFTWKSWSNGFACNICGQIYDELQDCTSQIKSVDENDEEILIDCTGNVIEQFTEADDKYTFGFIAQELLPNLGTEKEYNLLNHNTEVDEYNYSQENLIAPLVKAVQELSTKVDSLTARIEVLEG